METWGRLERLDVGGRITGLSETSDGDLQIDMEGYETLILTADEVKGWLQFREALDAFPDTRCEKPLGDYVCRLRFGHNGSCKRERFPARP